MRSRAKSHKMVILYIICFLNIFLGFTPISSIQQLFWIGMLFLKSRFGRHNFDKIPTLGAQSWSPMAARNIVREVYSALSSSEESRNTWSHHDNDDIALVFNCLHCFRYLQYLGKDPATKSDEFLEKCQKGVIFNPNIYIADFGNFKQGFLSIKLIKRRVISGFRVCFVNDCIDINWY